MLKPLASKRELHIVDCVSLLQRLDLGDLDRLLYDSLMLLGQRGLATVADLVLLVEIDPLEHVASLERAA
jgi:hypothetical protein